MTNVRMRVAHHGGEAWAEALAIRVIAFLAFGTVLTHLSQFTGLPFWLYSVIWGIGGIATILEISRSVSGSLRQGWRPAWHSIALFVLMLAGAFLALSLSRPDIGDYYTLPNLAHYIANPAHRLGFGVHWLVPPVEHPPIGAHSFFAPQAWGYQMAALAWLTHIPLPAICYFGAASLVGTFIPLSIFLITRSLAPSERSALIGTLVALLVVLLMGDNHRVWGNMSFSLAWQGRALLLAVLVPLTAYWAVRYAESPSWSRLLPLALVNVAAIGAAHSAFFIIPPLTVIVGLASQRSVSPGFLLRSGAHLCLVTLYAVVVGASFRYLDRWLDLSFDSPVNADFPTLFGAQVDLMVNPQWLITKILIFASLGVCLLAGSNRVRITVGIWTVLVAALFLNPIVQPMWMGHITTPSLYWQLFYLLPFPAAAGWAAAWAWERMARLGLWQRRVGLLVVLVLLIGPQFIPMVPTALHYSGEFGLPRYKVDSATWATAGILAPELEAGPSLAPPYLAGALYLARLDAPQYNVGDEAERTWLPDGQLRHKASLFVSGFEPSELRSFQELIKNDPRVRNVVIRRDELDTVVGEGVLENWLTAQGYNQRGGDHEYAIYSR